MRIVVGDDEAVLRDALELTVQGHADASIAAELAIAESEVAQRARRSRPPEA